MRTPRGPLGRIAAIAVAAVLVLLVLPSAAAAHPYILRTSPADGSQLSSSPSAVVIYFDESVRMAAQGVRIVDGNGRTVKTTSKLTNKTRTLTITPASRLGRGRWAAAYNVWSVEGHFVPGAIAFTVATPTVKGSPIVAKSIPNVPVVLDGDRPGVRTISITTSRRKGQVLWRSPRLIEPMTWDMRGDGKVAKATGVLPMSGPWTFEIDLSSADNVLIPKGSVTLK
jgi:methionine-rich copper-binding protein CopC